MSPRKAATATRESLESIGIRQFCYRAVSLGDGTIEELDRYRGSYTEQQALHGVNEEWPAQQNYQAWFNSLAAWRQLVVLARAIERQSPLG